MAFVRYDGHGKPKGTIRRYVAGVRPIGYPNTAAICRRTKCESPGLIWLDTREYEVYQKGQRIFEVPNNAVKIRAVWSIRAAFGGLKTG